MNIALSTPMKWTASSLVRIGYLSLPYWKLLRNGGTTDVTGLFVNPDFTSDNTGWTKTGNGEFKHANEVAEVWNGTDFEVCQEVTRPSGRYI